MAGAHMMEFRRLRCSYPVAAIKTADFGFLDPKCSCGPAAIDSGYLANLAVNLYAGYARLDQLISIYI
jgi:hypothetical protein